MEAELNAMYMVSRAAAHDHLKDKLQLPDYYGRNLDALYDLLSAWEGVLSIRLVNSHMLEENLGGYGNALLTTLREADENNPNVHITIV